MSDSPIFGSSPAMHRVLDDVNAAAATEAHVIICGEPGTGRELVAREVHRRSGRAAGPFVRVAYTAGSDTFDAELFGQTTRSGDRPERRATERIIRGGHLYDALGGTIFFVNLPEMPARTQARLARVLRDGQAAQGKTRVTATVRVIAALEQGYAGPVKGGRIHEDLFCAISGRRIDLPPLRQRREDIPALVALFLAKLCRQHNVPPKQLTSAALQIFCALPWHGNAPEVHRLLSELVQRVQGEVIDLTDVLATVQIDGRAKPFARIGTLREARARFEREYIAAVMTQHHGRIPDAAKTLGVQRPNLYRKLRRLNVPKVSQRKQRRSAVPE